MSLYFNVDPYYDDFDQTKNFHRILFRPGRAVQARELTQSQTILQDQITKFADNIFKQNSPVTGGQITTNFDCYYVKLQTTFGTSNIDVAQFDGLLVKNSTGTVIARVVKVATATGTAGEGDPPTLILVYKTGNHFQDNDVIYDVNSNLAAQAIVSGSTGQASVASIAQGVFYILGNFVQIQPYTVILEKYNNTPSKRVGLTITETIYDYINDPSLLDPAIGASNYQAPGADRYYIGLTLDTRPIQLGDDQNFIELVRVVNGDVQKLVDGSVYNVIDDYFAKRDYETNGDYIVNDFKLTPRTNVDSTKYTLSVGKGLAYVHGYRVENQIQQDLVSDRARATVSQNNNPVFIDFGSYLYVDNVRGANASFFDVTTTQTIDLHCVTVANVNTSSAAAYTSTVVGSGYVRGLVYDHDTNDASGNTFVYKAYVNDIQLASLSANAVSGGASTITLPATYSASNTAYVGVNIQITQGTSAGDFRTITAYNGVSKVATVNQAWTATPDTTSVFVMNFGVKDTETIVSVDGSRNVLATAAINPEGKDNGLSTGNTVLENPNVPELIFNVGSPYISDIKNTSYTTEQLWRSVSFTSAGGSVSAQINFSGALTGIFKHLGTPNSTLSADIIRQNYAIVVTNKGSNSSIVNGDIIPWTTAGRTVTLDSTGGIATFSATDLSPFTATIVAKVYVVSADNSGYVRKFKNLITANTTAVNISGTQVNTYTFVDDAALTSTGQVYIQNAGLVSPGTAQSLYLSDVKNIVKIIDTKNPATAPNAGMLTNGTYDVTNNYVLDNGQKDSHYDHATITLKPGAPKPAGNLLVLVNYYQHTGGDGYFCLTSYTNSSLPESYTGIGTYISKNGTLYSLRDSIDFRPARKNAQSSFIYRYSSTAPSYYGVVLPVDLTLFTEDYSYYLGRKDKLVLTKDKSFNIIQGAPSLNPLLPSEPDGSLVIANITHRPYTGYLPTEAPVGTVSDLSIEKVKHKRFTMQDIAGLENRINNIEYYSSLSLLEQKASSLQISDAYGLNRFKNGIIVDDFSSYATADTLNSDYSATINRRERVMTATQNVKNFPLKSTALVQNMGSVSDATLSSLGYGISSDGEINYFTLPYTTANAASQKFASRTVNVNPFSYANKEGVLSLTPNMDNWVDTNYAPALLITDPNLQVFQASNNVNVLQAGDWKTIPGTTRTESVTQIGHGINPSPFGYVGYNKTSTYSSASQTNILGAYDKIGNTYAFNNGYITDISVLPFIRPQQIILRNKGMLFNAGVDVYFDGTNVNKYVRKTNVIELTGVTGTFNEGDVVGYYSSGSFHATARVVGVYQKDSTTVRLYVAADPLLTVYTPGVLQNAFFDTNGNYTTTTANGTLVSTSHFGAAVVDASNSTKIKLAGTAPMANSYYTGNTIHITSGTGAGQSATITNYFGANQTAILSSSITCANGDIYSIGTFNTDEIGSFYGVFNLPSNTFHNGQRVLRVDNSNGNPGAATTYAESTFYSEGLQTTQQSLDFGASPAGAKNTFTQVNKQSDVLISQTYSPWDPIAQTFIFDKANYPNGLFLNSANFFFATKPTSDNSPITLSIIGTLNGYPNGQTLDHSIVTLYPNQVKTSSTPQHLDSTTSTTFTFSAPVYIQPGVLYAFLLKTNSKEYTLWTASNGDTALASSVKNLPSDPTPSSITKIGGAPYVGGLFLSQNSQTWSADQNQSLMFVADRCVFNTAANPTLAFVVPKKLPQRTLIDQSVQYYLNANNISSTIDTISNTDVLVDAFNITTTDFIPTTTGVSYSYAATLQNGSAVPTVNIVPGKFATPTQDDIYLSDGQGERILLSNTNSSFTLNAQMISVDDAVSPVISDAGLSTYAIQWNINNCELSNNLITVTNGGSNYNASNVLVTFSAPTGKNGTQAYGVANVVSGNVTAIYVTTPGSGYVQTPTVTISVSGGAASGATATVAGETGKNGGNAASRYVTKKVVLDPGFDSGDLNVYLTAYRPVNTDIQVYYKILNRNDTQKFEDGSWQLMTKTNNCDSKYSQSRSELFEYTFAPGNAGVDQGFVTYTSTNGQTYTTFSQFALKIVFTTSDKTFVPFATDMRCIALPSNVNTTV